MWLTLNTTIRCNGHCIYYYTHVSHKNVIWYHTRSGTLGWPVYIIIYTYYSNCDSEHFFIKKYYLLRISTLRASSIAIYFHRCRYLLRTSTLRVCSIAIYFHSCCYLLRTPTLRVSLIAIYFHSCRFLLRTSTLRISLIAIYFHRCPFHWFFKTWGCTYINPLFRPIAVTSLFTKLLWKTGALRCIAHVYGQAWSLWRYCNLT